MNCQEFPQIRKFHKMEENRDKQKWLNIEEWKFILEPEKNFKITVVTILR